MTKLTVAGVVKDKLDSAPGTTFDLATLIKVCRDAGIEVEDAKIYGSIQVMASTGKAVRGEEKKTWRSVEVKRTIVDVAKAVAKRTKKEEPVNVEQPTPKKTKFKATFKEYAPEHIVAKLKEKFGEPTLTRSNNYQLYFLLDGSFGFDYIEQQCLRRRTSDTPVNWHYHVAYEGSTFVSIPL